jgi:topoisomerase-4 subunit A
MTKDHRASDHILNTSLDQALGERYLSYALSTIMARSLPDVRDGLKPVQRRILYAMQESGNTHEKPHSKSASAVGFVMMRYHPHGDSAIYDALVRMAQDFSSRYPLVDGQGNFGSLDGDNAAAMRYTESRLSHLSSYLMDGIHDDAVDFMASYNGRNQEPLVLPARFPNLLANGATGIAVGMATNIPPHHGGELCRGLIYLIENPDCSIEELLVHIPGPDFPTGGVLIDSKETFLKAYENGRGSLRVRAKWHVEQQKNGLYQIVVTHIPFQVQKSRLLEKLADLWNEKKLPFLGDIRDESTTDVRLVLTPKSRSVDPVLLMESVFKVTELESRFNINMNVLDHQRVPKVMNLKEILKAFLNHRQEILCRRARNRILHIEKRLEILDGLYIAFLNIERIIQIVRFEDDPKATLILEFSLTEVQGDSILNMRLKALHKLEELAIENEKKSLALEKEGLEKLLLHEKLQWKAIIKDLKVIEKLFPEERRTIFECPPSIDENAMENVTIEREPCTILCSENGWIRMMKGHTLEGQDIKYKEGDQQAFILKGETTDKILIFTKMGKFYTLTTDKLPGGRSLGEPLSMMIDISSQDEVISMMLHKPEEENRKLMVVSCEGRGFMIMAKDVIAQTRVGKQIMNLPPKKRAFKCLTVHGDTVAMIGNNRKLLLFSVDELPQMLRGQGVILQRYREGEISDIITFNQCEGLSWTMGERVRRETDLTPWVGRRGQSGRLPPVGFPRHNTFKDLILS